MTRLKTILFFGWMQFFGTSLSTDPACGRPEQHCDNMLNHPSKEFIRRIGILERLPRFTAENFDIFRLFMDDDGTFPNNKECPLVLYKNCFLGSQSEATQIITGSGQWTSPWVWGIFPFHHYHSNAWELLLCTRGEATIQLGGPTGPLVEIARGDLMLVPPGLAHKQLTDGGGFTLLGSYPIAPAGETQYGSVDTLRGPPTARERENIASCPSPPKDPFFGLNLAEVGFRVFDQSD